MIDLADNQNLNTNPDVGKHNSILKSLVNDSQIEEEKVIRAELILLYQMEGYGLVPDLQTYKFDVTLLLLYYEEVE